LVQAKRKGGAALEGAAGVLIYLVDQRALLPVAGADRAVLLEKQLFLIGPAINEQCSRTRSPSSGRSRCTTLRPCSRNRHRHSRSVCEVTFIAAEDLHDIERETGVGVKNGEHRRNVVTRGISLKALRSGERFRVGEVVFEYRGPRSVCRYIERLTEPGMTQALKGRGGICARVIENGTFRVGDEIEVL
jgi:hypothetical protein